MPGTSKYSLHTAHQKVWKYTSHWNNPIDQWCTPPQSNACLIFIGCSTQLGKVWFWLFTLTAPNRFLSFTPENVSSRWIIQLITSWTQGSHTHTIHGKNGISTYVHLPKKSTTNVGKYTGIVPSRGIRHGMPTIRTTFQASNARFSRALRITSSAAALSFLASSWFFRDFFSQKNTSQKLVQRASHPILQRGKWLIKI